jgi:hypothetical protein
LRDAPPDTGGRIGSLISGEAAKSDFSRLTTYRAVALRLAADPTKEIALPLLRRRGNILIIADITDPANPRKRLAGGIPAWTAGEKSRGEKWVEKRGITEIWVYLRHYNL